MYSCYYVRRIKALTAKLNLSLFVRREKVKKKNHKKHSEKENKKVQVLYPQYADTKRLLLWITSYLQERRPYTLPDLLPKTRLRREKWHSLNLQMSRWQMFSSISKDKSLMQRITKIQKHIGMVCWKKNKVKK